MSGNNETTIGNTPRFPDGGPTWHEALKIRNNGVFLSNLWEVDNFCPTLPKQPPDDSAVQLRGITE